MRGQVSARCNVSLNQPLTSGVARVQCVAPGPVARSMMEAAPEQQQHQRQQQPRHQAAARVIFYEAMKLN